MALIVPAILVTSKEELVEKLTLLRGLTKAVQIDVVDGHFAAPATWPYANPTENFLKENRGATEILPYLDEFKYEMDLMVNDPETTTGTWIDAGASRIVLHAESTRFLDKAISTIQVGYGHAKDFAPDLLSLGIGINIGTEISFLAQYMDKIDFVQFMGIRTIGTQGQAFDEEVLKKISEFKRLYPAVPMQVDGGVSLRTAPALLSLGVEWLIVGSGIWGAKNMHEALAEFTELAQEYSI